MRPGANLATRFTVLLLAGFVLLQLVIFASIALPSRGTGTMPYNLPPPDQLEAMAEAIETASSAERPAMMRLFNGSLFTINLQPSTPPSTRDAGAADLRALESDYTTALRGRHVSVIGVSGQIGGIIRRRPGPMRYFSPVRVTVSLRDGEALVVDSRPSPLVRTYLRQRSLLGLMGGLAVLAVLVWGIRATTRPLIQMSAGVRRFATALDSPDLPVEGSREVRELSIAFNDMKSRIGGLISERTRILAAIAHDMRTYLTRLRLRVEFIDDPGQQTKATQDLEEMGLLLDDTLLFVKTDAMAAQSPQGRPERIDLGAELSTIVWQRTETGDAVTMVGMADGTILIDRLAFRRMLANLIDNGLRYGTAVNVKMASAGGTIDVSVEDNGPGVPVDALARLGEPYARIDPARDRSSGGAGLGLAIVRGLAHQAGATLNLVNREPHGLQATIRFPLYADPEI